MILKTTIWFDLKRKLSDPEGEKITLSNLLNEALSEIVKSKELKDNIKFYAKNSELQSLIEHLQETEASPISYEKVLKIMRKGI